MKPEDEKKLDAAIDQSLKRAFDPPDLAALASRVALEASQKRFVGSRPRIPNLRLRYFSAVAAILLILASTYYFSQMDPGQGIGAPKEITEEARYVAGEELGVFYEKAQAQGFPIFGSCGNMADLSGCVPAVKTPIKSKVKTGTLAFQEGRGLKLLGESRAMGENGPRGLQVIVGPEKAFIFVFAYPLAEDPRPILPKKLGKTLGLNIYRRELGNLVLYELSPLRTPMAVLQFYMAN